MLLTIRSLYTRPVILVPFILVFLIDLVLVAAIVLAPFVPQLNALASLIAALWGEPYLHYPAIYSLLPELFNHIKNIENFTLGALFVGVAISVINQTNAGNPAGFVFSLTKAYRKFFRIAIVWGIMILLASGAVRAAGALTDYVASGNVVFCAEYILLLLVQAPFIFAIPAIVVENRKLPDSIARSFRIFLKNHVTAILIVLFSGLIFTPVYYLYNKIPAFSMSACPESTLYVVAARILLAGIRDVLLITSATLLFLAVRKTETGPGATDVQDIS